MMMEEGEGSIGGRQVPSEVGLDGACFFVWLFIYCWHVDALGLSLCSVSLEAHCSILRLTIDEGVSRFFTDFLRSRIFSLKIDFIRL